MNYSTTYLNENHGPSGTPRQRPIRGECGRSVSTALRETTCRSNYDKKVPAWIPVRDGHGFESVMASILVVFVDCRNLRHQNAIPTL
jgi:hypothetical protein